MDFQSSGTLEKFLHGSARRLNERHTSADQGADCRIESAARLVVSRFSSSWWRASLYGDVPTCMKDMYVVIMMIIIFHVNTSCNIV